MKQASQTELKAQLELAGYTPEAIKTILDLYGWNA